MRDGVLAIGSNPGPGSGNPWGQSESRAARVKALRIALGYRHAAAFARRIGMSPTNWNHVEMGRSLPIQQAIAIVQAFPTVTLDFLYRGGRDFLPPALAKRIDEELQKLEEESQAVPPPAKRAARESKRGWKRSRD